MKWTEALKAYAAKKGIKYMVPKKGSPEYAEVRAMMDGDKPKVEAKVEAKVEEKVEAKVEAPKAKKARKAAEVKEKSDKVKKERKAKMMAENAPKRKVRGKKVEVEPAVAVEAKPPRGNAKRKAGSVPAGMIPEGATKKAVMASKNPEAVLESATNAHLPIVAKEEMVSLRLPKPRALKQEALPTLVEKDKPVDAVPFSFQKLRYELGC